MREKLTELLAKVEGAAEGSEELDARILCVLLAPETAYVEQSPINGAWCIYVPPAFVRHPWPRLWETPREFRQDHASVTQSIDAALLLLDQKLPGWSWGVSTEPPFHGRTYHAYVAKQLPEIGRYDATRQSADYQPGAALAVLTAMLRALIAQDAGRSALAAHEGGQDGP